MEYRAIDKFDSDWVREYAKKNGLDEHTMRKFLEDYFLDCFYRKVDKTNDFVIGGILRITKKVKRYCIRKYQRKNRWGFWPKMYVFNVFTRNVSQWKRGKPLYVLDDVVITKDNITDIRGDFIKRFESGEGLEKMQQGYDFN